MSVHLRCSCCSDFRTEGLDLLTFCPSWDQVCACLVRQADAGEETRSPVLLVHYSRGLLRFRLGIVSRPVTQSFTCTVPLRESKFTVTPLPRESEREVEVRSAALPGWRHHKPALIKTLVTTNESQFTSVMCQLCVKEREFFLWVPLRFLLTSSVFSKHMYAVKYSVGY